MASSGVEALKLYRTLLKESQKFANYNYRTYARRRIRDAFKEHKNESDPVIVNQLIQKAKHSLEVISRQAAISQMYDVKKIVIEEKETKSIP